MMSALLIYSIKSVFVLALLYVPYTLMLHRESFFRFNRFTLLAILVLSLVLPLCNFHFLAEDGLPTTQMVHQKAEAVCTPIAHKMKGTTPVPPEVREKATPDAVYSDSWSWHHILSVFCCVGMLATLLFRLWQFVRMGMLMRHGCVWKGKEDGFTIYCHADDVAPCSWMGNIIISHKDYIEHRNEILLHEQDTFFITILLTFCCSRWCNWYNGGTRWCICWAIACVMCMNTKPTTTCCSRA